MSIISKLLSTSRRTSESLPSRGLNLRSSYANRIVKGETRHRSWRDRIGRARDEDLEAGFTPEGVSPRMQFAPSASEDVSTLGSEVESLRQSARNNTRWESLFDNKGEPITLFDVDGIEVGTLTRDGVIINGLIVPPSSVEVTDSYEDSVQDLADDKTAPAPTTPAEPRVVKTSQFTPARSSEPSDPNKPAVANKPEPIIAVPPSDPIGRLDPPISDVTRSELKDIRNALDGIIKGFKSTPKIDLGEEEPEEEETPDGVTKDKAKQAKSLAKSNSGDDASDLAKLAKAISIVAPSDSEPEPEPTSSPSSEPEPEPTEDDMGVDTKGVSDATGAGADNTDAEVEKPSTELTPSQGSPRGSEEPADDLQTVKDVLGTVDHHLRVTNTKAKAAAAVASAPEEPTLTKTTDNPKVRQFVPRKRPPRKVATAMKPIPTTLSKDVATIPDPMGEVKGVALDPQKEMKEIVNS